MCTKLSGILFFNWIIKNNYQNKVKICIQAHDEWNVEAPKEIANEVADILQQCMEKGAHPFCPRLPLSSGISYLENNELPDFWIH
jgi:DNA polymerase I-like protein with 3'-5' exonuclease and polymerase domains